MEEEQTTSRMSLHERQDVRRGSVEVTLPQGGMNSYGMVAGIWVPGPGSSKIIFAPVEDTPFLNALCGSLDEVRHGVAEEFARTVEAELETTLSGKAGLLVIDGGATARVGSNERMFRAVAATLGSLLVDGFSEARTMLEARLGVAVKRPRATCAEVPAQGPKAATAGGPTGKSSQ